MIKKTFIIIAVCFLMLTGWVMRANPGYAQRPAAKVMVVLDPAHGGADSGVKIAENVAEKDITMKLALLTQKELQKTANIQVLLTRDQDVDISVQDRMKKIDRIKPKVMVSLHINSGFYKTAKGFELYFPGFKSVKAGKDESSAIISDMKKNKYLNESVRMAQNLQKHLESVFPKENRGLREAPVQLLEGLVIPSVIVEIGFSGHAENRKKIMDEKFQQDIARALSKGIRESL